MTLCCHSFVPIDIRALRFSGAWPGPDDHYEGGILCLSDDDDFSQQSHDCILFTLGGIRLVKVCARHFLPFLFISA
jgi:hypothetical protein